MFDPFFNGDDNNKDALMAVADALLLAGLVVVALLALAEASQ